MVNPGCCAVFHRAQAGGDSGRQAMRGVHDLDAWCEADEAEKEFDLTGKRGDG